MTLRDFHRQQRTYDLLVNAPAEGRWVWIHERSRNICLSSGGYRLASLSLVELRIPSHHLKNDKGAEGALIWHAKLTARA